MLRPSFPPEELRHLVAEVAAAYFSRSQVGSAEISSVIAQIANSLEAVGSGQTISAAPLADLPPEEPAPPQEEQAQTTEAQIRKSITPDALISFEDGKAYRTLRLHLASRGLTPDAYRAKWGLPPDYPMVAPNYSAVRSQMAKQSGLGRHRKRAEVEEAAPAEAAPPARPARGRAAKAARTA